MSKDSLSLAERDAQVLWHPYSPLAEKELIAISRAQGELLYDEQNRSIVDLISSWWVTLHGHNNPDVTARIKEQLDSLDHVIFAGFTHKPAIELAEKLITKLPHGQKRLFLSDNGSTAVEVAIKMAIQFWAHADQARDRIVVLSGSYHGDTVGAMSVSERGVFTNKFSKLLFDVAVLPRPIGDGEQFLGAVEDLSRDPSIAAFLYEPLVQGASGMFMYDEALLDQALRIFQSQGVLCIADEVMTGFGRTGKWFASDYLKSNPDIITLSKGITGGFLPLGATSCNQRVEQAFLDSDRSKMFFHGHSYTGNPISCAAAVASIELLNQAQSWSAIARIEKLHQEATSLLSTLPHVSNIRLRGTIIAFDLVAKDAGYLNPIGLQVRSKMLEKGFLVRPLGNVVYLMPPYCISEENLYNSYQALYDTLTEL